MNESAIQSLIHRELGSRPDVRLFRNNTGMGWIGKRVSWPGIPPGAVLLLNARPLHAGLHVGSGDNIGWTIKSGHAIFTSIEVKSLTGRPSPDQINWHNVLTAAGGISCIAKSPEDAVRAVDSYKF